MILEMRLSSKDSDMGFAGSEPFIRGVAAFLVLAGMGLATIRYLGGSPAEDGLEGALGAFALGAPVMATGALALLALRGRAVLLIPAAVVLVPMSFLSFALVTLPLLVPAVMLSVGYRRRSGVESMPGARAAATLAVVVPLLIAAVGALLVHQDPREYTTSSSSGSTSDVITSVEALISLLLTATSLAAGWFLSAPVPSPAQSSSVAV
jgi:hypothetical protein